MSSRAKGISIAPEPATLRSFMIPVSHGCRSAAIASISPLSHGSVRPVMTAAVSREEEERQADDAQRPDSRS